MSILKSVLAAFASATLFTIAASAATQPALSGPDVFRLSYFVNETFSCTGGNCTPTGIAPGLDDHIYIVNPGTSGGNLCANIYVWDPSEELVSCCATAITPNELVTTTVGGLLTNPASAKDTTPHSGVIKIISSTVPSGGHCNPATVGKSGGGAVTPELLSWMVHLFPAGFSGFSDGEATEEEFLPGTLSAAEEGLDVNGCAAFAGLSGAGTCVGPVEAPAVRSHLK
ncbi:MAG: hypothetical protein JOY62_06810 [Acidobacteriaceae bacterium]|nr:hypothetical protein [Acidobacteriaceae bacterium]MBV9779669.1 hypothetical protein [Acidobacteriaceae bacterium]